MSTFPVCELHGIRIVSQFPPGCATAMPGDEAQERLARMKRNGFWPGEGDPAPFVAMARAYHTCMDCQDTLRADPHVGMLRERLKNA